MDLKPKKLPDPEQFKEAAALVAILLAGRPFRDVTIPRTDIKAAMRQVTDAEATTIAVAVRRSMEASGLPTDAAGLASLGVVEEYNAQTATQHLAIACRDPLDITKPLASLESWQACDRDQISALWITYQDFVVEHDPLGMGTADAQDMIAIEVASKKKDVALLLSYGSRRLAHYLATSADQPANSPTPP